MESPVVAELAAAENDDRELESEPVGSAASEGEAGEGKAGERKAGGSESSRPYPTRYPRLLQIFIFLFVFDLVVRGVLGGIVARDWNKELSVQTLPKALPTQSELTKIRRGKSSYDSVAARFGASLEAVAGYFNPIPREVTLSKIGGASDWLKYASTWTRTRLRFVGKFTMINHSWPMFSPNTRRARSVIRSRMIYADGTVREHYPFNEPRSFTDYSRWLVKRPQKIDERLQTHHNARMGMANYLSHAYSTSKSGAPLDKIEMYKIGYRFPVIGADVRKHWKRVRARAKPELIWRYDPSTRRGRKVSDKKSTSKGKRK